jgi:Asp-tRNA(Asn)/Glu-tRNA(Gln) amidotransferase A subunit family amidase
VVGFKPTFGLVSIDGVFPLAPTFDHAGPMARDVATCAEMMAALVPGFESERLESLEEVEVGVAWTGMAEPLVRARVEAAAALFPRTVSVDPPLADDLGAAFRRDVAEVHGDLYAEHRDLYGPNVGAKVARCLEVTDSEYEEATRDRDRCRERLREIFDEIDLLLTPTLACVPHPVGVDELEIRELYVRFTLPFNATGAPALALPCGPAELGLPASVQLIGPPGADALVLAAGELLEAALRPR